MELLIVSFHPVVVPAVVPGAVSGPAQWNDVSVEKVTRLKSEVLLEVTVFGTPLSVVPVTG